MPARLSLPSNGQIRKVSSSEDDSLAITSERNILQGHRSMSNPNCRACFQCRLQLRLHQTPAVQYSRNNGHSFKWKRPVLASFFQAWEQNMAVKSKLKESTHQPVRMCCSNDSIREEWALQCTHAVRLGAVMNMLVLSSRLTGEVAWLQIKDPSVFNTLETLFLARDEDSGIELTLLPT